MPVLSKDPKTIYLWEAGKGLEHACYHCPMKANNPNAINHCFGVHCVPCFRYHQTMHAIGASHNCSTCINVEEVHAGRHRRIAELLAEYKSVDDQDDGFGLTGRRQKGRLSEVSVNVPDTPTPVRRDNVNDPVDHEDNGGEEDVILDDSVSTSRSDSHSSDLSTPKPSKADLRRAKRAARSQRSQDKAAKCASRHIVSVKNEDVEYVKVILHGNTQDADSGLGHPLATDKDIAEVIERNRSFVAGQREHRKLLLESIRCRREGERLIGPGSGRRRQKRAKFVERTNESVGHATKENSEVDEVVDAILMKLGVGNAGNDEWSKAKSNIVDQLRAAIADDLTKHENEQRETYLRAGGFWRYVGKGVFERMTIIARTYNWKTGELLRPDDG